MNVTGLMIILIAGALHSAPCAVWSCRTVGTESSPIQQKVRELLKALSHSDAAVRAKAADQLGELGPEARDAVPALIEALSDKDDQVSTQAVLALARIGPRSIPPLLIALEREEKQLRSRVLNSLELIGPKGGAAVPRLVRLMKEEKDGDIRERAMDALSTISSKESVPGFVDVIVGDPDDVMRLYAISSLCNLGPKAHAAIPSLISVMKAEPNRKGPNLLGPAAAGTLASIGVEAVPPLIGILEDKESTVELRTLAAWALGEMPRFNGPESPAKAVYALIECLKSDDRFLRLQSAHTLGKMQRHAKKARRALGAALQDEEASVRIEAAYALYLIDPSNDLTVSALVKDLQVSDRRALGFAADSLRRMGPKAKAAVPDLIKAMSDDRPEVRANVIFALQAIGPDAREAIPALKDSLLDKDDIVRKAAGDALRSLQK